MYTKLMGSVIGWPILDIDDIDLSDMENIYDPDGELNLFADYQNAPMSSILRMLSFVARDDDGSFYRCFQQDIEFWILFQGSCGDLMYGLYDFDEHCDVIDRLHDIGLEGHIYKSAHGYHVYTEELMTLNQWYLNGIRMQCCKGFLDLGKALGHPGLRIGLKPNRLPDLQYIGHSSGLVIAKSSRLLFRDKLHQILCSMYTYDKGCAVYSDPDKLYHLSKDDIWGNVPF